jgi:asparagine synthetase B (glutamine-hydrolysing)
VAKRVGIKHRIISVSSDDVKRLYPVILSRLQEPPRHYNNIVLARIYEEAARVAKIIISGEPGDTLFGSGGLPPIYREARKREFFELFPRGVQKLMASALQAMPMRRARSLGHIAKYTMDELLQQGDIVATGRIGKQVLRAWGDVEQLSAETIAIHDEREGDIYSRYQTIVLRTFIRANERRDVRLAEAFGASMFYPLLDPAVTEIATRLPEKLKFDPSIQISKRVLRWVCAELCGNDVAHWSKLGFPTPEQQWIEGPLRDAWETCQQENALVAPFLDRKHLPALISSGDYHPVWTVMTLNSILERMQQAKVATVTD